MTKLRKKRANQGYDWPGVSVDLLWGDEEADEG